MFIIKNKKIFIGISLSLVVISLLSLVIFGVRVGIDFKGGALTEAVYPDTRPPQADLESSIGELALGSVLVQPAGENSYIIKSRDLSEEEYSALLLALTLDGKHKVEEANFNSVGPSVGRELTRKAIIAVILVSLAIILFIAFAFRKVSHSSSLGRQAVASWKYGFIAVVTLLHDVAIPVGLFVALSYFYGAEIDTLFVVAILTVLGLSVSDTIVIFDRIRENLRNEENSVKTDFHRIVGKSLEQSYVRSICTSLTVILVLFALLFFGPQSTKYFALMLTAGMIVGTYSSICLASPLLVLMYERQNKKSSN